jgi:predicted nuclease with TOPRIM domain
MADLTKTRVDDMLIEMITPKIQEIERKFGQGIGLTQDDINTLLLKSQYNHINHLDTKLNEVVGSVQALEGKFLGLEGKFHVLEGKFHVLEEKFHSLEVKVFERFDRFEASMDLKIQTAINGNMRWSIGLIALIVTALKVVDMLMLGRN